MRQRLPLNFILSFCRDMIPENGEDSYCHSFCDGAGILGVFDGCGGTGARKYNDHSGKTEAYVASRLCAGAFYDSFRETFSPRVTAEEWIAKGLAPMVGQRFARYAPADDGAGAVIRSSLFQTLPTTAAAALIRQGKGKSLTVSAIWAGDSRVYLLDADGLAQLTADDTTVPDPMDSAYDDGILKNIISSQRQVKLNCRTVQVEPPFMVFSATDGCFGYVSTPMEFEGILLNTLLNSETPAQWEENLAAMIGGAAGDDHTLCLAAFGYSSFTALRKSVSRRYAHILKKYLNPVSELPVEDRQSRYKLWEQYRADYMRYLEDS